MNNWRVNVEFMFFLLSILNDFEVGCFGIILREILDWSKIFFVNE